ncbi:hypothetical protein CERSUDRAFT_91823 [Gelatoporia subvermispora B]|uniref:Uncharacterized protein n=1 Tax=Ceriporiopsis subvermispora (strain B) TaxID=914234 RepID=M2RQC0_CERS8|nr:hypothetical protein CERSUDRAFT_91823 [Gelatoporia subvermispora B]
MSYQNSPYSSPYVAPATYPAVYTPPAQQVQQLPQPYNFPAAQQSTASMPTYYLSPGSNTLSRSRSHSNSYGHTGGQPVVYQTAGVPSYTHSSPGYSSSRQAGHTYTSAYPSTTEYYDERGRRNRTYSTGGHGHSGGATYVISPSSHSSGHHRSSSASRHGHGHRSHSTTRRSTSHSRHHSGSHGHHSSGHSPRIIDVRTSSSHHGHGQPVYLSDGRTYTNTHSNTHHRRNSDTGLGDRIRNWFSGPTGHSEYIDARTGRPVDKHGRPIYRV